MKASNTDAHDVFGSSVAFSQDGRALIVGAEGESSSGQGVGADQSDNSAMNSGAAYVFQVQDGGISQQEYIKASDTHANDEFGGALTVSADGTTIAVGAVGECGRFTGVNPPVGNCDAALSGAVYIFDGDGSGWTQQAYVKASNAEAGDQFGGSVALSADGSTLAVAAEEESSAATGINGDQSDNSALASGAVYLFSLANGNWAQTAYIKASNTIAGLSFGYAVALSGDGKTLVVGTPIEDSSASGVNGDQSDHGAPFSGAVYVFVQANGVWVQQAYLKASNTNTGDGFGGALALSENGSTLAVGAPSEQSASSGINGQQDDNSLNAAGAVYVFEREGTNWSQQAYVKASNPQSDANFGYALSVSADGTVVLVGAYGETSSSRGVNGDEAAANLKASGASYLFARSGEGWGQKAYIKASNTGYEDRFGDALSLTGTGSSFAIAATGESSAATGIDGNQDDDTDSYSGAVYVFDATGGE